MPDPDPTYHREIFGAPYKVDFKLFENTTLAPTPAVDWQDIIRIADWILPDPEFLPPNPDQDTDLALLTYSYSVGYLLIKVIFYIFMKNR
jgi:hypothetical protein